MLDIFFPCNMSFCGALNLGAVFIARSRLHECKDIFFSPSPSPVQKINWSNRNVAELSSLNEDKTCWNLTSIEIVLCLSTGTTLEIEISEHQLSSKVASPQIRSVKTNESELRGVPKMSF